MTPAFVVQRDMRCLAQIEIAPRHFVAVFVLDLEIPHAGLLAAREDDVDRLAVLEHVTPHDVLTPLVVVGGGDVDVVDAQTGLVDEREIELALRGQRRRRRGGNEGKGDEEALHLGFESPFCDDAGPSYRVTDELSIHIVRQSSLMSYSAEYPKETPCAAF